MRQTPDGVSLAVKVIPRAKQTRCLGFKDEELVIRLAAPPVDGKANLALITYLAKSLGLKKSQVEIVSGRKSRKKVVVLRGATLEAVNHLALDKE